MIFISGCDTTYQASRSTAGTAAEQDSVTFVRPDRYSILGTRSIREYVEVVYEESQLNSAGLLVVNVGLRNKGGQRWYDRWGPNFSLSVKTTFYDLPLTSTGPQTAPVYETNWQTVVLIRGDIQHFQVICPVPAGRNYQLTISEQVTR